MDQRGFVPTQSILLAVCASLCCLVVGHACGFAVLVIVGMGALGTVAVGVPYAVGVRRRRTSTWRGNERRAVITSLLGFGVPAGFAIWAWQTPSFDGLLLHSGAAAVGAALVALFFTAILTSSMIDWYLILPFVFGLFGRAIWVDTQLLGEDERVREQHRRRRYAQLWVFHRGVCELLVFSSVAFLLAIALVAIGNALSSDKTLPVAIESLGGAAIGIGIFGYLGERLRGALSFVLSGPVRLGDWVEARDPTGPRARGLVVAVSIHPGVILIGEADLGDDRTPVPLAAANYLSRIDRPDGVDDAWCEEAVIRHLGDDPGDD